MFPVGMDFGLRDTVILQNLQTCNYYEMIVLLEKFCFNMKSKSYKVTKIVN